MDLGIVVVSWNVRDLLAACLDSAFADLERCQLAGGVWVVDNHSTDGSPEMTAARFPQAHLIANDHNAGFAAANNQALRAMGFAQPQAPSDKTREANARRVAQEYPASPATRLPFAALLLNPDTVVKPGALGALVGFLRAEPRAGVAGPKLLNPDGTLQECAFEFPGLWQAALDLFPPAGPFQRLLHTRLNGRYPRRLFEQATPFPIGHPLGAAFMVRGEAIAQAGLMDESYQMYCEEIDWAWRLRRAGWPAYCVPQAEVVHYGGQSAQQVRDEAFVNLWRSRKRLYDTYRGPVVAGWVGSLVRLAMRRRAQSAAAPGPYLEVARLWR